MKQKMTQNQPVIHCRRVALRKNKVVGWVDVILWNPLFIHPTIATFKMKKETKVTIYCWVSSYLGIAAWWALYLTGNIWGTPSPLR